MPKIVDANAQRRDIRDAARRVFARRGVQGTGLAHVAAAAGMGRSSLYHYYPKKASLVGALARDLLAEEEALFAAATRGAGSSLERIERLAAGIAVLFEQWAQLGRVFLQLWASDARRFRPLFRRLRADLAAVIAEGQRSGEIDRALEPTLAAAMVIGAIDGLLLQHLIDPDAFGDLGSLSELLVVTTRKALRP